MKTLSIVIVNYNVKHFLEQTLTSVFKALDNVDAEVFVVDNDSVDGSCALVEKKFPSVKLIANKDNVGFSKANNQAMRLSNAKYVLLLNPDTVVQEDTFEKCVQFMEDHQDCGGLGVKMVDGSGKFLPESKRGLPTPWVAFYKVFGLASLFPRSKTFGKYHLTYLDKESTHEVEILSGAFMFMRMEALDKSGLLDEDYFMYGEDIDLSYRLIKAGYKNYYYPGTNIIHYKGESTKKSSVNYVLVFYNAMIIFAKKHFSSSNAGMFTALIKFAIYLRAGISLTNRFVKRISWVIFDFASIFGGMYFLKTYWENNHKYVPETKYPAEYMQLVVPAYILIWLVSIYLSGGYDKPFKPLRVVRGVLVGALIISAGSNFVDAFRFSKALIILGSTYAMFSVVFSRSLLHFVKKGDLNFSEDRNRNAALVGSKSEVNRVRGVLNNLNNPVNLIGNIYTDNGHEDVEDSNSLGNVQNLGGLVEIYKLQELIFCARDVSAATIIHWMTHIDKKDIEYKIVPDDSNFIIGSSSKETQGDYYTLDVELNINKRENVRGKKVLDVLLSVSMILLFPLLILTKRKFKNLGDAFRVLFTKLSWVGISPEANTNLPNMTTGVFSPVSSLNNQKLEASDVNRLNVLYAKDYTVQMDLAIVLSNF